MVVIHHMDRSAVRNPIHRECWVVKIYFDYGRNVNTRKKLRSGFARYTCKWRLNPLSVHVYTYGANTH